MECTTLIIKLNLKLRCQGFCDYGDAYILVKGTITLPNTETAAAPNNRTKKIIFQNCAPFTDCVSEIHLFLKA